VLDSLEDPQNVGTLLRSAEAAGVHGIVFPTRRQAPLTPAAIKASAGAVEHLLLCPVDDLAATLADLHGHGMRVAGSEADAPLTARQADLRGPLALVVGSEGQGLGPAVRKRCDLLMRIPMRGAVGSLNAAVAGSILLFEAVAQRDPDGLAKPRPPAPWPTIRQSGKTTAPRDDAATDEEASEDAAATGEAASEVADPTAEEVAADETADAAAADNSEAGTTPADAPPAEAQAEPTPSAATPIETDDELLPAEPPKPPRAKRKASTRPPSP
jgi:tRNA(Leu) C34 or U34 (ribose-2'-O)-methylase TrmL